MGLWALGVRRMLARVRPIGGSRSWARSSAARSALGQSRRLLWRVALLTASALLLSSGSASAIDFTVTRNDDPAPGACDSDCSLREAVIASNQANSSDAVLMPAGTYTLSIAGPGGAAQGDLDITDTVNIQTLGPGDAVIDANGDVTGDRGLELAGGGAVLRGVTIAGGVAPADGDGIHRGGGVRVPYSGGFAMFGGEVSGNSAPGAGGQGGGIYSEGAVQLLAAGAYYDQPQPGTVDLGGVTVQSNTAAENAGGQGGGIYIADPGYIVTIEARIFNNHAASGGAVYHVSTGIGGYSRLSSTYVSTNTAQGAGGAIFVGPGGKFQLHSSTVNSGAAGTTGGGIRSVGGVVDLQNVTITGNSAGTAGGMSVTDDLTAEGVVKLHNTIVAENTDSNGANGVQPDCLDESGGFRSDGYNIIGAGDGCGFPATTGDQVGTAAVPVDPGIAATSTFNGGFQLTRAIDPGGNAEDAGDPDIKKCGEGFSDDDARGVPVGLGGRCDVGAYQLVRCRGVIVNRVGALQADVAGSGAEPLVTPTAGDDGILGLGRGDTLLGDDGSDGICGGKGADELRGEAGDDELKGDSGRDRLFGGPGTDICIGGKGVDTARGCETQRSIP